jgi:tetratricopeptide (TPR) repeat protein
MFREKNRINLYRILAVCCFCLAVAIHYTGRTDLGVQGRKKLHLVPPLEFSRLISLGHPAFLADLYFSRVLTYVGSQTWDRTFKPNSDWAYGMMNLITDLDPHYYQAYLFAGLGLIHEPDDVKRAKIIIDKGMAYFPDDWHLPFWVGYYHYAMLEDYETASEYLWQAMNKPNAPTSMLATMISAFKKGGDFAKAIKALEVMVEATQEGHVRDVLSKKLVQLKNMEKLQNLVEEFNNDQGHYPDSLNELISFGYIGAIPSDPIGWTYYWDNGNQRISVK